MSRLSTRVFFVFALAVAVGLATGLSPYASSSPDGLERVAQEQGFRGRGRLAPLQQDAPVPDYVFPGVGDPRLATALAGFTGTIVVFVLAVGVTVAARRRPRRAPLGG